MKIKLRLALGALLCLTLFVVNLPLSLASPTSPVRKIGSAQRGERTHIKQGSEVAKRVKQLQKFNKNVRSALADFEKNEKLNGHSPKHDESFSITMDPADGSLSSAALKSTSAAATPFRKIGFKAQTPDYSGYGVEMIFIPTYSVPGEWQGTAIFNEFDPSGAYLGQYVADVAMVVDPTATFWDVIYEVSYQDGEAYLQYGNPGFELGTPGALQGPGMLQPLISAKPRPEFLRASFGPEPQRGMGPHIGIPSTPKMKWVMKCTTIWSVAGGVGCGITSIFTGGTTFVPCALGAAAASFTGCTLTAIFGS